MMRAAVILKIASGLALSRRASQRWRQLSLVCAVGVAAAIMLAAAAVVHVSFTAAEHVRDRSPLTIEDPQGVPKLALDKTMPIVGGGLSQIPVLWLEPLPGYEDDPGIVPPGLSALPEPGAAVLSPALVKAGYSAADFGFKSSSVGAGDGGAIGDAGLTSRGEGLIYVRSAGRTIQSPGALLSPGYASAEGGGRHYVTETVRGIPSPIAAITITSLLLVMPSLFLVAGAARAMSIERETRALQLGRLGITKSHVRAIAACEAILLAGIGVSVGAIPGLVWLRGNSLPETGASLLPGSLRPGLLGVCLVAMLVLTAAASAATLPVEAAPLERRTNHRVGMTRVLPLVAGLGAMYCCPWILWLLPNETASDVAVMVLLAGAALTLVALPWAMPSLAGLISVIFRDDRSHPAVWLAARRLSLSRGSLARPAAMVGILVFVAGSTVGVLRSLEERDSLIWPPGESRNVWAVNWNQATEPDVEGVRGLSSEISIRRVHSGAATEMPNPGELAFASCGQAEKFFGMPAKRIGCGVASNTLGDIPYVVKVGSETGEWDGRILVSTPRTWDDARVMKLFAGLPVVNVVAVVGPDDNFVDPLRGWLSAGLAAGSLIILGALVRELCERVMNTSRERRELLTAGLLEVEVQQVFALSVILPVLWAVPLGYAAAVIFSSRAYGLGVSVFNLARIGSISVCAAVVCLGAIGASLYWQSRVTD